jgi:hypothetical protein
MTQRTELAGYMRDLWWYNGGRGALNGSLELAQADGILKDPDGHLSALVEAGLLERVPGYDPKNGWYRVLPPKPPHVHDFYISNTGMRDFPEMDEGRPCLLITCRGCNAQFYAPNRFPIEIPELEFGERGWHKNV